MNIEFLQRELNMLGLYNREKKYLELKYIKDRLNKSIQLYYNDIEESLKHLNKQDDLKLLKYLKQ